MDENLNKFIRTIQDILSSMKGSNRLMNYQKPLFDHACETVIVFENECVGDLSKCLKSFFGKVEVGLGELFKKEIEVVIESVGMLLSYKPSNKWYDKAISLILTVIGSIKNFVSDYFDENPLVKVGLEMLEEAMKFIKK